MLNIESFGIIPLRQEGGVYQVLLILHSKGVHWGFPKGRASPNETPLESATRELKEETGLDIAELLSLNPIVERYQFRHRGEKVIKVVHYFPALVTGALKLQVEEVRDAKWYTFRQALDQLTFKEARYILKECMDLVEKKA